MKMRKQTYVADFTLNKWGILILVQTASLKQN